VCEEGEIIMLSLWYINNTFYINEEVLVKLPNPNEIKHVLQRGYFCP
jgi:hypothetical protein